MIELAKELYHKEKKEEEEEDEDELEDLVFERKKIFRKLSKT